MKQTNSKPHLLSQDLKESTACFEFKQFAYAIAEKCLTFFVKKQVFGLKKSVSERLLQVFEEDCKRIDAVECSKAVLECLTEDIL